MDKKSNLDYSADVDSVDLLEVMMRFFPFFLSLFFLLVPAGASGGGMADGSESQQVPQLTVRGEAILKVPADQFRLRIGVVTEAANASRALEENSRKMDAVILALKKTGLTEKEYKTGRFQVRPNQSPRPRQAPPDWRPRIVGYTVTNSLNIRTQKIELAGRLIGAAGEAGANEIDSIRFDLSDPRAYRAEAIRKATENALEDAHTLAESASVSLVEVLSLQLDSASATPITIRSDAYSPKMMTAMEGTVPPISSGEVTVQAGVILIYRIEKK